MRLEISHKEIVWAYWVCKSFQNLGLELGTRKLEPYKKAL